MRVCAAAHLHMFSINQRTFRIFHLPGKVLDYVNIIARRQCKVLKSLQFVYLNHKHFAGVHNAEEPETLSRLDPAN